MKEFIFIALTFSLIINTHQQDEINLRHIFKQKLQNHMIECTKQYKIQTLIDSTNGKPPSKDFQCFVGCMYIKLGFMDPNGAIQVNEVKNKLKLFINEVKSKEIMERCMKEKGNDGCETAYKISKCSRDVIKNIIKTQRDEN